VLFLAGPDQRTMPREMFAGLRESMSPIIASASVILIGIAGVLVAAVEGLKRRG
jgi:putative spermidine/putrescine transport system permease protein